MGKPRDNTPDAQYVQRNLYVKMTHHDFGSQFPPKLERSSYTPMTHHQLKEQRQNKRPHSK